MKNFTVLMFFILSPFITYDHAINQPAQKPECLLSKRKLSDYKADTIGTPINIRGGVRSAEETIDRLLECDGVSPYLKAEYLYSVGLICLELGGRYRTNAADAFRKSAVMSNELAVTNLCICNALLAEGGHEQLPHVDEYIATSLQNARIFGSEDMSGIIKSAGYPISDLANARNPEMIRKLVSAIVSVLLVISAIVLFILYRNYRTLKKSYGKLRETHTRLADSNRMKETYITFFLNRSLEYLEEFGRYKKYIHRSLSAEASIEKIKQEIASTLNMDDDYNGLLSELDRLMLELYPCFVDGVNDLLKSGQSYTVGQGGDNKLNTELRILALVKLGITDNKQIASFLRITVQSVYNYRSKARGRAIDENTFDDDLARICM